MKRLFYELRLYFADRLFWWAVLLTPDDAPEFFDMCEAYSDVVIKGLARDGKR